MMRREGRMRRARMMCRAVPLLLLLAAQAAAAQRVTLAVRNGTETRMLATGVPTGDAVVPPLAVAWERVAPGLETAELELRAGVLRTPVRVVAVRIEPALFDLRLEHRTARNRMTGTWTVDSAATDAALALNAGQFTETGPFGWLVLDGRERREPGTGALTAAVAIDSAGAVHWLPEAALRERGVPPGIRFAFQSYPLLLRDGRVPPLLRDGAAVDLRHRDARLILARDARDRLLVLLTRYDGFGTAAGRLPIGLTLPESIVLAQAFDARDALMLDGGVSAQVLVRDEAGVTHTWRGIRRVPLALVAVPRD